MPPPRPRLSYSKLRRWELCRKSFWLHYIERKPVLDSGGAALLGTVVHETFEQLERAAIATGKPGIIRLADAMATFRRCAIARGLVGVELFTDGLRMVEDWRVDRGWRDPKDIVALEHRFVLRIGRFDVEGAIDLVVRIGDREVRIVDYKSQRALFDADELRHNLQLSIYEAAVREAWPEVRTVRLTMWLLRHRLQQPAERTPEQLAAALAYVAVLGEQIAAATEFPAHLGPHCAWCDHRNDCIEYRDAVTGGHRIPAADLGDPAAVLQEREQVVAVNKLLAKRQRVLDKTLTEHLTHEHVLDTGTHRAGLFRPAPMRYPLAAAARALGRALGVDDADVVRRIAAVDKRQLDRVLADAAAKLGRARAQLLRLEIEAASSSRPTQRVWVEAVPAARPPSPSLPKE